MMKEKERLAIAFSLLIQFDAQRNCVLLDYQLNE